MSRFHALIAALACSAAALAAPHAAHGKQLAPDAGIRDAAAFREYRVFHTGRTTQGHPLEAVIRERDALKRRRTYSFVYGECATGAERCLPPFEVQSYNACARNLATYRDQPEERRPRFTRTRVRGVPAIAVRENAQSYRLEIYTGRTTVVVFGADAKRARALSARLRSADGRVRPFKALPAPARGHLSGRVRCAR